MKLIRDMRRRNPNLGMVELWHRLRQRGYTRRPESLFRVMKKLGLFPPKEKKPAYKPKPYPQMTYPGQRIQVDVKVVPRRCIADPELRRTQSGVSVTSFRIANDRDYGKGEEKETDFFDVVAWRSTAEFICKYFTKGRMISVDGRLQTRGWKDREGNNRVSIEVLVDNAYFADSKKDDAAGDFPADDQFAGYGAYQGSVPGGGDDFAPDF